MKLTVIIANLLLLQISGQPSVVMIPSESSTASISGTVTDLESHLPIAGTRAILLVPTAGDPANPNAKIAETVSGQDGHVDFKSLAPGRYLLTLEAKGYSSPQFAGPNVFVLSSGQNLVADFRLRAVGYLTGHVRNTSDEPQAGIAIQLVQISYDIQGRRATRVEGNTQTNDRGEYGLSGVTPGRYYLMAVPPQVRPTGFPMQNSDTRSTTFYPHALDLNAAVLLNVEPRSELAGIDLVMESNTRRRITGGVVDPNPPAKPIRGRVSVRETALLGRDATLLDTQARMIRGTSDVGTFTFDGAAPGSYFVYLRARAPEGLYAGITAVDLRTADAIGVSVNVSAAFNIPVRFTIDGPTPWTFADLDRVRVELKLTEGMRTDDADFLPSIAYINATGNGNIGNVFPGKYWLAVEALPKPLWVKSAKINQVDVFNQPLVLADSTSSVLEVELSARIGAIKGVVSNPEVDLNAVLIPQVVARTDLFRVTNLKQNGEFEFTFVPPGDYTVAAVKTLDVYSLRDTNYLRQVVAKGTPVHVDESATVNVRVTR